MTTQMSRPDFRIAIIGGGAAGLTTLKHTLEAKERWGIDIEVRLFEAEAEIGGVFKHRVWEGAELVSSKYLTAFSDFRIPSNLPDFITPGDYVRYLHAYCDKFNLWPYINLSTRVENVTKIEHPLYDGLGSPSAASTASDSSSTFSRPASPAPGLQDLHGDDSDPSFCVEHILSYRLPCGRLQAWTADAMAVCSGLNYTPNIPDIPGLEKIPQVMHSSDFRGRHQFPANDGAVAVLGVGETGQDMAYMAVTEGKNREVALCHRRGFMVTPKVIPEPVIAGSWGFRKPIVSEGCEKQIAQREKEKKRPNKPLDCAVASLFDTAYVPQTLQHSSLLWDFHDMWVRAMFWMISGTTKGLDQWIGGVEGEEGKVDALFMVKSTLAMPFISAGHRSKSLLHRIRSAFINIDIPETNGKTIDLAPWPTHVDEDGYMHFASPSSSSSATTTREDEPHKPIRPELLLLATGYRTFFPFLSGSSYAIPQTCDHRGFLPSKEDNTTAFIGFIRPTIGAIPPLAELQSQAWLLSLLQPLFPSQVPQDRDAGCVGEYEIDFALCSRGGRDMWERKRGVDGEGYTWQMALDIGSAPSFSWMAAQYIQTPLTSVFSALASVMGFPFVWIMASLSLSGSSGQSFKNRAHELSSAFSKLADGLKILYVWAMGPNFNPKFILLGPWAQRAVAEENMKNELWNVVKRSGGGVFWVTYTVLPLVLFGGLSLGVWGSERVCDGVKSVGNAVGRAWGNVKGRFGGWRKEKNGGVVV